MKVVICSVLALDHALFLQVEHVPGLEPPQEAVGYSPGEQGVQLKVQEYDTLSQESVSRPSPVAKAI